MNTLKFRPELTELEDRTVPAALVVDGRTPIVNVMPNGQLQKVWVGEYNGETPLPLVARAVMANHQIVAWQSANAVHVAVVDFAGELLHQSDLPKAPGIVVFGDTGSPPLASVLTWQVEIQTSQEGPTDPGEVQVIWVASGIHQSMLGNVRFAATSLDGGYTFGNVGSYTEPDEIADDDAVSQQSTKQQLQEQPVKKRKLGKHARRVGGFFARHR